MARVYYVTYEGDQVDGPFDSKKEAKARADELMTNEVGLNYDVTAVEE